MGIGPRRPNLRAEADHRLEKAMDQMRVTKSERVMGRKLFEEIADKPNRPAYGAIVERVTRDIAKSREAGTDATGD